MRLSVRVGMPQHRTFITEIDRGIYYIFLLATLSTQFLSWTVTHKAWPSYYDKRQFTIIYKISNHFQDIS